MCLVMDHVNNDIYTADLCSCSKQTAAMKKEEDESRRRTEERQANQKKAAKYLKETNKR